MGERYRALVIGCGRIGSRFDETGSPVTTSHAGAYARHPRVKLEGLCDQDVARAKEAASYWTVEGAFQDPAEALETIKPDIVSICTPDAAHGAMLRLALQCPSVRAILAEKPLALSATEARVLAEEAQNKGITLVVNYSRRFHSAYRMAYEEILQGRIGEIRTVTGYYSRGIKHNGTHWIDLVRWFVGEIAAVKAEPAVIEIEEDPTPDIRFEFKSGAVGLVKGVDQRLYALFEMDILGTLGRLRVTQGPRFAWSTSRADPSRPEFRYLYEEPGVGAPPESTIATAVSNLLDCLEKRATVMCSAEDAVRVLEIAEACERSLKSGRTESVI